jgi:hypothetical protein
LSERRTGLILPHAPILLPEVLEGPEEGALARVRAACATAARGVDGSRTLIASPHATHTGVYISPYGDLADLGPRAPAALCPLDLQLAEEVAGRWGRPVLDEPLDHGIVVPLLVAPPSGPIVAIGFKEGVDAIDDASALAAVLTELGFEGVVIASANLSVGVTERAPLTRIAGAEELEIETVKRLEQDSASLLETAPRLATRAGSCGAAPLTLFGSLFGGSSVEVLAHEWPYGVGYLVARTGAER